MEDYNKIIESFNVRFISVKNINILQPLTIENYYDVENVMIYVHKGEVKYGKTKDVVLENEILFIPGGKMLSITYGSGDPTSLSNDDFINIREDFFQNVEKIVDKPEFENITFINFDVKVFNIINFFTSLNIPPFTISNNHKLTSIIKNMVHELDSTSVGRGRVMKLETDRLVIELIRHILDNGLFVEQFATNSTYFKDPRLIDIFTYIKDHLKEDLSNRILATIANVSEDYVGQYFKILTGINPQDYIEYQRMEMAVNMLRTSKKSIREIGKDVGYNDTAYFCRRFKMMFGIPAGKMRRRETLINI